MEKALVVSILVHAAILAGAPAIAGRLAPTAAEAPSTLGPDLWTGTSIEVSTGSDDLPGGPVQGAAAPAGTGATPPANAGAAGQNTEVSPPAPPALPSATASAEPATPKATAAAPHTPPVASAPAATQRPQKPKSPRPARSKRASRPAAPAASGSAVASASPAGSAVPSSSNAPAAAGAPDGSGAGAGQNGTFGAEGQAQKRDLGRAFTRAIPAACAADPVWGKLAAGDAGTLRVEIRIDGEGHIAGAEPLGDSPPKHLVNILRRTIPLLQAGIFAVRGGAVSAGTQTLELKAKVSDEGGDDSGARDNLAFSYDGGRGKASFTQSGGRRVDVSVRVVSVKVSE